MDGFDVTGGKLIHVVPVKFNSPETTPLTVTITDASEVQRFEFDLPSKD